MSYIVIELQKETLDPNIRIVDLLRKSLVVAKKLKLIDFENWINLELNGYYETDIDIPKYRHVVGQLKAWNPYNGWVPTIFRGNDELNKLITNKKIADPISNIESLMKEDTNELCCAFTASVEKELGDMFDFVTTYKLFISKSQFQVILEAVRTAILKWSLQLESDGVLGEEMVFNQKEKEVATSKNYTVNNFYGDVRNSQIQQLTSDSQQK